MKSIRIISILGLLLLSISTLSFSQEKFNEAIDFTMPDTEGNIVCLFDELENDKTVILFFFSSGCSTCHMEAPVVDSIFQQFGSGEGQLLVWGIASINTNADAINEFISETEITFPCFQTGHSVDVFSLYGIDYTPQVLIICDYLVSGSISFSEIIENLNYCFPTTIKNENNKNTLINISAEYISVESSKQISFGGIFDITGKLIKSVSPDKNQKTSTKDFIPGNLYIINIMFADGTSHSEKFIIR